jgi:hypothetical protein
VQALKFCRQRAPCAGTEVVFGMREHNGCIRVVDGTCQSFAQLRRTVSQP